MQHVRWSSHSHTGRSAIHACPPPSSKTNDSVYQSKYRWRTHMSKCTHMDGCHFPCLLRLPSNSPLPAVQGPDYHFITACHYSDAINGNELADNWFTITLPSSPLALRELLVLIDSFLLSALSHSLELNPYLSVAVLLQHDTDWI